MIDTQTHSIGRQAREAVKSIDRMIARLTEARETLQELRDDAADSLRDHYADCKEAAQHTLDDSWDANGFDVSEDPAGYESDYYVYLRRETDDYPTFVAGSDTIECIADALADAEKALDEAL